MARKKYKKQYTTKDRLDMSKGGRVGYQKGGPKRKNDPVEAKDVFGNIGGSNKVLASNEELSGKSLSPNQNLTNEQIAKRPTTRTNREGKTIPVSGFKNNVPDTKQNDQMFIGRKGDVRPQASQPKTKQAAEAKTTKAKTETRETWWSNAGYNTPKDAIADGWKYDPNSRTWTPGGGTTTGGTTTGGTTTETTEAPITGTPEQIEEERRKRGVQAGRTAEQIAAGEIPEGMVPSAEAVKIMERRPDETQEQYQTRMASMEAEAVQIEPGAA